MIVRHDVRKQTLSWTLCIVLVFPSPSFSFLFLVFFFFPRQLRRTLRHTKKKKRKKTRTRRRRRKSNRETPHVYCSSERQHQLIRSEKKERNVNDDNQALVNSLRWTGLGWSMMRETFSRCTRLPFMLVFHIFSLSHRYKREAFKLPSGRSRCNAIETMSSASLSLSLSLCQYFY